MSIAGRTNAAIKQAAFSAGLGIAVLAISLAGLGFLTASLYVLMTRFFPPAGAAAITGAGLILAMLIGAIGAGLLKRAKKRQPSLLSEFGGTLGLTTRLITMLVRRDPKKAIILATLSGAIAEYVLSDNRK
jgi:tetrahydromethanopterin S-methyltransferase subunit C